MRATPESKTYAASGEHISSKNDAALLHPANRQRSGEAVELARGEPGNVLKSP